MNAPAKPARVVRLNPSDNVVVAVDPLEPGAEIEGARVAERVPRGHKLATVAIDEGAPVRKFGQIIGFASKAIAPGQWVHEHNCGMGGVHGDFGRDYRFAAEAKNEIILPLEERATFEGYRRADGKVGTRNYIGILTSVNCSASVAT
ncbi:MAG: SAF domain-containing protein, partial [Beijerinckiaceae bacterium]